MARKTYTEAMEQLVRDLAQEFDLGCIRSSDMSLRTGAPLLEDEEAIADIARWLEARVSLDDRP